MATFTVSLQDSEERFACDANASVLAGMARLGRRGIPCGCRGGGCGVCKVTVLSGQYQARAMSRAHISEAEQQAGTVLACWLVPAKHPRRWQPLPKPLPCLLVSRLTTRRWYATK